MHHMLAQVSLRIDAQVLARGAVAPFDTTFAVEQRDAVWRSLYRPQKLLQAIGMNLHLTLTLAQYASDAVGHLTPETCQPWRIAVGATAKPRLQPMGTPQLQQRPEHAAQPGPQASGALAIGQPADYGAQHTPEQESRQVNKHRSSRR